LIENGTVKRVAFDLGALALKAVAIVTLGVAGCQTNRATCFGAGISRPFS